jgi:Holliday junction DNA helicase RuvA
MISLLRGKILEMTGKYAVLDVNNVGYKIYVTADTLHSLKVGSESTLWTYLAVREDALDLYGFLSKKDKDFFELLITVSSIGPKSALNILSLAAPDTLASAIRTGSTAHLVKVSGIGRKTAEKIVLELKDKLGGIESEDMTPGMSVNADVIEALKALGYDADEAREALKKLDPKIEETGAKVKAALKMLS